MSGQALLMARTGQDLLAQTLLDELRAEGVETGLIRQTAGAATAFSSIYIDSDGERQIVNFRGAGLDEATDWIADLPIMQAVLTDNRWPAGAQRLIEEANRRNIPSVVDVEAPVDLEPIREASHLAFSRQGLIDCAGVAELDAALEWVASQVPGWVGVTDGEQGMVMWSADGPLTVPAPKITAVDTLGAGDVWHGAFALRLAEGGTEVAAARFANAAAALKCTRSGARAGMPDRARTDKLVQEISP